MYVTSAWADKFVHDGANLFAPDAHSTESDEWKKLARPLNDFIQEVYDDFLRKFVDAELTKYEEDGIFPSYAGWYTLLDYRPTGRRWNQRRQEFNNGPSDMPQSDSQPWNDSDETGSYKGALKGLSGVPRKRHAPF